MPGCHAPAVEIPRGDLAYSLLDNSVLVNMTVLGDICWVVAYALIIRQCARDRSYGLPLVAIAMNFTWELHYSLVQPPRCDDGSIDLVRTGLVLAWAALDVLIVRQLLIYGREQQSFVEVRQHFKLAVWGTLVLAFFGNLVFAQFHPDSSAPMSGVIINFVMSVLFVFFAYARPDLRGISWSGACFRVTGNTLIFVANIFLLQDNTPGDRHFALFLFIGTAIFDAIFLHQVRSRRLSLALAGGQAG